MALDEAPAALVSPFQLAAIERARLKSFLLKASRKTSRLARGPPSLTSV